MENFIEKQHAPDKYELECDSGAMLRGARNLQKQASSTSPNKLLPTQWHIFIVEKHTCIFFIRMNNAVLKYYFVVLQVVFQKISHGSLPTIEGYVSSGLKFECYIQLPPKTAPLNPRVSN